MSASRPLAMRPALVLPAVLVVLSAVPARAEWLSGASREIPRADSASPDAPVTSYGYGPRAVASLGGELGVWSRRNAGRAVRVGAAALVGFENGDRRRPLPNEALRVVTDVGVAWAFWEGQAPESGRLFELGAAFGASRAFASEGYYLRDPILSDDVPFGAGGYFLAADAAFRAPLSPQFRVTTRVGGRAYVNAFPDAVGASEASNYVANGLHEGAQWQLAFEAGFRWLPSESLQPLTFLYADVIAPHDDSAKTLWLGRLLSGVACIGSGFELVPFVSGEAGHGAGILVNRTELRLAVGVRLHAR